MRGGKGILEKQVLVSWEGHSDKGNYHTLEPYYQKVYYASVVMDIIF